MRTGAPQPHCRGRPRAPQPGPPPPSPPRLGPGPHRGPPHPLRSPPGVRGAWPHPSRALPQPKREGGWGERDGVVMPSALIEVLQGWSPSSGGPPPPSGPCLPTGPQLAAVLGLGLGLLAPVAAALALLLHHRAWRLPPSKYPVWPQPRLPPKGLRPLPTSHLLLVPPPQVETASGPPSKRSTLTPTPPWPRSEQLVLPPQAGGPEGLLDVEGHWGAPRHRPPRPVAPHPTLRRFRCSWAGTQGSATYAVHTPCPAWCPQ